jgi:hypothetical protein
VRCISSSALRIRQIDPDAKVDINTTTLVEWGPAGKKNETAYSFHRKMCAPGNEVNFDTLTNKPILIHEWGYSSLGGFDPAYWPTESITDNRKPICDAQAWPNAFAGAHNEDVQASNVPVCLKDLRGPSRSHRQSHVRLAGRPFLFLQEDSLPP